MLHNKYHEILKQFLGDFNRQIYGRNLIEKVKLSQKNIAITLNELEENNVLISQKAGNMKYFSLNKENPLIVRYLMLAEIDSSIEFLRNNPKINHIINAIIKNQIIVVFGSYAKGLQKKDSDLDLLIIGNYDKKKIREIRENYGIKISIKNTSKEGFIKSMKEKNMLMNEILNNHIILSGYEEFVLEVIKQKW